MQELITGFVGLDAHAESTAIAVAEAGRAAPRFVGSVGARLSELTKALSKLGAPQSLCVVYEAGPCGYVLARELTSLGYRCEVVAPSRIPRRPGERIKTDRRDALNLASLARAGELVPVDRKSTRLNSSHEWISYAVCCLKKKIFRRFTALFGSRDQGGAGLAGAGFVVVDSALAGVCGLQHLQWDV